MPKIQTKSKNDPALTYTLSDFINMQNTDDVTYRNFSILEIVNGIELVDHNVFDDYIKEFNDICVDCELTAEEAKKYKFSPDLLAYDVYGSVQVDFLILLANGMIDPKEFTHLKTVKLPYASKLKNILTEVYKAEQSYIYTNRAQNGLKIFR